MATEVIMRRAGEALFPVSADGAELLQNVSDSRDVKVIIKQARHPEHHRKFFALLSRVQENCDERFPTIEVLLVGLKYATGHVDTIKTEKGTFLIPRSIDFANMSQDEFGLFYQRCIEVICDQILPGLDDADLERELLAA